MSDSEGSPKTVTAVVTPLRRSERRNRLRIKFSRPVSVASEAKYGRVEEVRTTVNVSRDGLYFTTCLEHYHVGMWLMLTFPYTPADPIKKEQIGKVVRLARLADSRVCVASEIFSRRPRMT